MWRLVLRTSHRAPVSAASSRRAAGSQSYGWSPSMNFGSCQLGPVLAGRLDGVSVVLGNADGTPEFLPSESV